MLVFDGLVVHNEDDNLLSSPPQYVKYKSGYEMKFVEKLLCL